MLRGVCSNVLGTQHQQHAAPGTRPADAAEIVVLGRCRLAGHVAMHTAQDSGDRKECHESAFCQLVSDESEANPVLSERVILSRGIISAGDSGPGAARDARLGRLQFSWKQWSHC